MPEFVKNAAITALVIVVTAGLGALLAATIISAWVH